MGSKSNNRIYKFLVKILFSRYACIFLIIGLIFGVASTIYVSYVTYPKTVSFFAPFSSNSFVYSPWELIRFLPIPLFIVHAILQKILISIGVDVSEYLSIKDKQYLERKLTNFICMNNRNYEFCFLHLPCSFMAWYSSNKMTNALDEGMFLFTQKYGTAISTSPSLFLLIMLAVLLLMDAYGKTVMYSFLWLYLGNFHYKVELLLNSKKFSENESVKNQ